MCGIAGIINETNEIAYKKVKQMVDSLDHRGPDGKKVLNCKDSVLGFTRLSIIDLSERSMQPFTSNCGRYVIVFNGEIYNFIELKNQLLKKHNFRSSGDAEVLLNAYIEWGNNFLSRVNGMFALCIYDNDKKEAILARDRFGQKPLFYKKIGKSLYFASEIKAFKNAGIKLKSKKSTWQKYLVLGVYDDDENTFFEDIYQIKPGHIMTYARGMIKKHCYYNLRDICKERHRNYCKRSTEELFDLLIDSVKIHTRADVEYSIGLSGGFDSSAILSLINQSNIKKPADCFTVDFDNHINESFWADKAANYFKMNTCITTISVDDMIEEFKKCLFYQESPLGGLMTLGQTLNFRNIKNNKYKVVLDGAGVDEIFCGYKTFHLKYLFDNLDNDNFEILLQEYLKFWKENKKSVIRRLIKKRENLSVRTEIDGSFSSNLKYLLDKECSNFQYAEDTNKTLLDMQIDYLEHFKLTRGLRMKDRGSMQNSIELRAPFIDHRVVEFALSLKEDCYFKHGRTKSIIRELFKNKMCESVRVADKRSINAPQGLWLRSKKGKAFINEIIESDSFKNRNLFNVKEVKKAYNSYCKNPTKNSFFIWQWINFELWHRVFIDK